MRAERKWMPARTCPHCNETGRFLDQASRNATVNYYRCESCGHIWWDSKTQQASDDKAGATTTPE